MLARTLTIALIFSILAAPAEAQQNPFQASAGSPPGITVVCSGSVPVGAWLAAVTFSAQSVKSPSTSSIAFTQSAMQTFRKAVEALGVSPGNIIVMPASEPSALERMLAQAQGPTAQVTVTVPLAMLDKVRASAKQANVGTETRLRMTAANGEALYEQAEALAVQQARAKAQAIAAADHEHVGRLVNFAPSQIDLMKEAAESGGILGAMFGNASTGMVTAGGLATFEIVP